jgi:hypothetical protein
MIIGLTGLAGSGKSTAAEYLVESHGFERRNFAGPLKKMLYTLDPILGTVNGRGVPVPLSALFEHLDGDELAVKESYYGAEYRRLLQVLGTDCIRAVDPDFWVKAALKDLDPDKDYVFDDVRFPNEADALIAIQAEIIHIERPGLVRGEHPSEQHAGRMKEAWAIKNLGERETLFAAFDRFMDRSLV